MLLAHLAMIVPGAVCVACAATARPRVSVSAVIASLAMLAAMIGMAVGAAPFAWTVALVVLALAAAVATRVRRGRGRAVDLHRPVGLVVMALLLATSAGAGDAAGAGAVGDVHAHGGASASAAAVVIALVYGVALVVQTARGLTRAPRRHTLERAAMAVMTAGMIGMGMAG